MKAERLKIAKNIRLNNDKFLMELNSPYLARISKPGQFIDIRCSDTFDPLLRRPFSIHNVESEKIKILYQVAGQGTELLSEKREGDKIDVLGPLGKGFTINPENKNADLIAGGIGIAPMMFLAKKLVEKDINTRLFAGAKTKKDLTGINEFKKMGIKVNIATEDGTCGKKGLVSCFMDNKILDKNKGAEIYICGPWQMMKAMAKKLTKNNLSGQVSLDKNMACGIGVCMGCVVKIRGKNKRVCADGPVFKMEEIDWDDE